MLDHPTGRAAPARRRRLRGEDRELLLAGTVGIGLLVALTGWLGVGGRVGVWAFQAQGLWRASSTLTYPNATAALLAPISLVVIGRLAGTPGSAPLAMTAAGLLSGLAATMSRTGALHAALRLVAQQPMTGTGPGHADLRWKGQDHGTQLFAYVHNEYLQVTAELGLVGLALLAVLLASIARLLWRARPTGRGGTTWAGAAAAAAAFAVHSGFDLVWHLPAVVLTVTLLVGAALPSVPIQEEEPDENQTAH